MKAHPFASLTVIAMLAGCAASHAPTGPTEQPSPITGIDTSRENNITTTSAELTTPRVNTPARGEEPRVRSNPRERDEDATHRAIPNEPRPPHATDHGVEPHATPRPVNTGDPCGWCR